MSDRRCLRNNMGVTDRSLRGVLVGLLLYVVLIEQLTAAEPWLTRAALAFTALNVVAVLSGWCPMYCLTGSDTRRVRESG